MKTLSALVISLLVIEFVKPSSGWCLMDGWRFEDGEYFTHPSSRCIKYLCDYGFSKTLEEGCLVDGRCHPMGEIQHYHCRPYRCEQSYAGVGLRYYYITPVGDQLCEDVDGECRKPGERFSYNQNGTVKQDCTCETTDDSTDYSCRD